MSTQENYEKELNQRELLTSAVFELNIERKAKAFCFKNTADITRSSVSKDDVTNFQKCIDTYYSNIETLATLINKGN